MSVRDTRLTRAVGNVQIVELHSKSIIFAFLYLHSPPFLDSTREEERIALHLVFRVVYHKRVVQVQLAFSSVYQSAPVGPFVSRCCGIFTLQ
jgi:hypothetical protein